MPLMQKKSKKAFEHNIKAEMEAGKPQKQALAIAYSVKRKPKKMAAGGSVQSGSRDMNMADGGISSIRPDKGFGKVIIMKAEGGSISANNEKRPMPTDIHDDSEMVRKNSGNKPSKKDSWTDNSTVTQAQSNNGRKVLPIARPKMVPSNAFSTRLYDKEGMLQEAERPGPYGEQPEEDYNEIGPDRQGDKVPDMQDEHSTHRKPYAKGGMIDDMDHPSKHDMEPMDDEEDHKLRLEEADLEDREAPSEDEGAMTARMDDEEGQDRQGPTTPSLKMKMMADGGEIGRSADDSEMQPEDEEIMERHNSIAAAIMAKRDRRAAQMSDSDMDEMMRLYEGGEILSHNSIYSDDSDMADMSRNHDEDANEEDQLSFNALRKENYNSSNLTKSQPMDSNEHGDSEEDDSENKHDMISSIRSKMKKQRQF